MDDTYESGSLSFNKQYVVFTIRDIDLAPPQTPVYKYTDYCIPTVAVVLQT